MNEFIEMKQKDIKPLREKIWNNNNQKCPVLNKYVPIDKMVLDHAHKCNNEEYSEFKGTIRTSLEFRVNAVLGKLENSIKRTGLDKDPDFDIVTFLHNAAEYFEKGAYKDENNQMYIHPTEVHKPKTLSKRNYNKLKKIYNKKAKFPEYPKSKKLTKKLAELFEEYNIEPYN